MPRSVALLAAIPCLALLVSCGGVASGNSSTASAGSNPGSSSPAKPAASGSSSPAAKPATSSPPAATAVASIAAAASAAGARPAPAGVRITLTQPKEGDSMPAGDVTVSYDVTGTTLVPAAEAKRPEDYHLHVLLDVDTTPFLQRFQPVPLGDDHIVHTAAKSVTFKDVKAGTHTSTVFLTTSNHISVNPPDFAKVVFEVK